MRGVLRQAEIDALRAEVQAQEAMLQDRSASGLSVRWP